MEGAVRDPWGLQSKASVVETLVTLHEEALPVFSGQCDRLLRQHDRYQRCASRRAAVASTALFTACQRVQIVRPAAGTAQSDVPRVRIRPTPLGECMLHRACI